MDEFFSISEVASRLKVSDDLIRGEIRKGKLQASPVGSIDRPVYRIARADLDAYLTAQRASKPAKAPKKRGRPRKDATQQRTRKKKGPTK